MSGPFGMHVSIPDCWDPGNRGDSDTNVKAFARYARRLKYHVWQVVVRRRWPCFRSLVVGAVRRGSPRIHGFQAETSEFFFFLNLRVFIKE